MFSAIAIACVVVVLIAIAGVISYNVWAVWKDSRRVSKK